MSECERYHAGYFRLSVCMSVWFVNVDSGQTTQDPSSSTYIHTCLFITVGPMKKL